MSSIRGDALMSGIGSNGSYRKGRCVMVTRIAAAQVSSYRQHYHPGLEDAARTLKEEARRLFTYLTV